MGSVHSTVPLFTSEGSFTGRNTWPPRTCSSEPYHLAQRSGVSGDVVMVTISRITLGFNMRR